MALQTKLTSDVNKFGCQVVYASLLSEFHYPPSVGRKVSAGMIYEGDAIMCNCDQYHEELEKINADAQTIRHEDDVLKVTVSLRDSSIADVVAVVNECLLGPTMLCVEVLDEEVYDQQPLMAALSEGFAASSAKRLNILLPESSRLIVLRKDAVHRQVFCL